MSISTAMEAPGTDSRGEELIPVRVQARVKAADDVVAITFTAANGYSLPSWGPGAHVDVHLGEDAGGQPLIRQYSLCGDITDNSTWRIAVLRDPNSRGGSTYVHDRLVPGSRILLRGPRNNFRMEPAGEYLFIAGGIGITPILPMVREVESRGGKWRICYMSRSRSKLALLEELEQLPQQNVHIHCDDEHGPADLTGMLAACASGTAVYACGPGGLLNALESLHCDESSWDLHLERFAALVPPPVDEDRPFEMVLGRTGGSLQVPARTSALEVLRDSGAAVEWSCQEGTCGTCEVDVLEGVPDHRDAVLTKEERESNESMMICVSRARGERLVLDL